MLNEGWNGYFKKSYSQFKPSSEDAFGDVLSGDKSYDGEQLCLGGFCLGTGRDASNWNYQSGKILLEKYSIENELLIEYGDLGERRSNWLKRYDIPKVHEWNNKAKLNGSPYEIVVDPNQVSGIQLGYLVSRPLNFPGFSLLGRTVASHEGLLFPWGIVLLAIQPIRELSLLVVTLQNRRDSEVPVIPKSGIAKKVLVVL